MPIRFRCVYCNQLLGISRRKAGTVVRCTNCGGQIIVPEAEAEVAVVGVTSANAGTMTRKESLPEKSNLLEQSDFDALLKPLAGEYPKLADSATPSSVSSVEAFAIPEKLPPDPAPKTQSKISIGTAIGMAVGLMILGVVIGFFVGRSVGG